jgi:hypothetical protein
VTLFERAPADALSTATPEERIAAVHAFTTRCRAYAVAEIARRGAAGRVTDEWESYLRFTDHTLKELEDGTLDHWFVEKS